MTRLRASTWLITSLAAALVLGGCVTSGPAEVETDPREAARANTELGAGYIRNGRNEAARERLERAVTLDERYAPAHATYAVVLARMGEDEAADQHFRRALRLTPEDPDIRNNYGAFLCARNRVEPAVEQFLRAGETPGYVGRATAYTNAGLCLRNGDPDRAETMLRQALDLNPQNALALEQLAWVKYLQGDLMGTRAFISRFERLNEPVPDILWLGAQTEAALGNEDVAADYRTRLSRRFPSFEPPRLEIQNFGEPGARSASDTP